MLSSDNTSLSYQPICFSKEALSYDDFDVTSFIEDCKRRVGLEVALTDVQKYTNTLQQELVDLINKDYTEFVNLSSNLVGLDQVIVNLRAPLVKMQNDMKGIHTYLLEYVKALEDKLEEKRSVAERRECLELFLSISRATSKLEELLHINHETSSRDSNILLKADEETSKLIQRVANDYNQLKFYVSRVKDLPFVIKMGSRIDLIESSLQEGMDHLFKEGINTDNKDIVINCLRTYAAIDRFGQAEQLFRNYVARKGLESIVSGSKKLDSRRRDATENTKDIFKEIIEWVKKDCSMVLSVTTGVIDDSSTLSHVGGFDFLGNAIWTEIVKVIESRMAGLFAPGIADTFIKNYTMSMNFVNEMEEEFCMNREGVEKFRNHPSYIRFMKKWNLPIYFHLRFQTIAGKLETSLAQTPPELRSIPNDTITTIKDDNDDDEDGDGDNKSSMSIGSDYYLLPSQRLWECLEMSFKEGIYTRALAHRFTRLSLQLLARYRHWIASGIRYAQSNESGKEEEDEEDEEDERGNASWTQLEPINYVYVYADLTHLSSEFVDKFFPIFLEANTHLSEDVVKDVKKAFEDAVRLVKEQLSPLEDLLLSPVIQQCERLLLPLRGITTTFRMTNKPAPTRHSYYVPNILEALVHFLGKRGDIVNEKVITQWKHKVLGTVCSRFQNMSTELLNNVRDTDRFLMKLRPESTVGEMKPSMSDTDKIFLQLYLDVEALGDQIGRFGVDKDSFPPYLTLHESVADAERLKATK